MDLRQGELDNVFRDDGDDDDDCINSDSDTTVRADRPSSARSDPFDEELPKDFKPRTLEWFFSRRPDPKKPISMFWTDREGFFALPPPEPESTEGKDKPRGKLGTMGLLEKLFVPRREEISDIPKWTIGEPLSSLALRRVTLDSNNLSQFSLARPPTPPRKSPRCAGVMSNKPLPPLPRPRRFASVGDQPLFALRRFQSTSPQQFILDMHSDSGTENEGVESIIDAYDTSATALNSPFEKLVVTNGDIRPGAGPYLLHRLHQYDQDQLEAIAQMEAALAYPQMRDSLRSKFLAWAQQLIDLNFPFRVTTNPAFDEQIRITEKDAHIVVDWAIEVGTRMNSTQDHIYGCLKMGDETEAELSDMYSGIDINLDPALDVEELYHKMAAMVQKKLRSPRLHEDRLLMGILHLYNSLLYMPFQQVKSRVIVVNDQRPHEPVEMPLNIESPLDLLKRILENTLEKYREYTDMTRAIRVEFFVPIERRIPGVSSRTAGYLNNVVGPSNVV